MIKLMAKRFGLLLYYVISALVFEVITFHILNLGFMPRYFGYNLAILMFIAFLVFTIPNYTAQYVIYTILLVLQAIFIYLNYSLFTIYGDLFSIEMPAYLLEATEALTTNFVYFVVILQLSGVFIIDFIAGTLIFKELKKDKIKLSKRITTTLTICILALELFTCGYAVLRHQYIENKSSLLDENYIESDSFLIKTSFLKASSYKAFGSFGYFTNLIVNSMSEVEDDIQNSAIEFFKSGSIYGQGDIVSKLIDDEGNELATITGIDAGNNVIMIMMESAEWFAFGDGSYDSEVNNLSSELTPNIYYLIYGSDLDLSADNTADNGITFKNYFAKSKTNFSEGIGIAGQYPVGRVLSDVTKNASESGVPLGYTLPNMLKNSDYNYYCSYVHSNGSSFYQRNETHKYLGFDNVIGKENILDENGNKKYTGYDLWWNHWAEETEIVNLTMDYLIPDEDELDGRPFFTFYLNVSSHGPYKPMNSKEDYVKYVSLVMYGEDNCELVNDIYKLKDGLIPSESYSNWYRNVLENYKDKDSALVEELLCYEASMVGLDRAIGVVIDELQSRVYTSGDKAGQTYFDNTTIILYSDHFSYYNNMSNRLKDIDGKDYSSIELQTIPMIISSPGIRKLNATLVESNKSEYCLYNNTAFHTHYDLLPTVLDLLGIPFNENFYLGSSVFAPARLSSIYEIDGVEYEMKLYYSNTGGIFGEHICTYDMKNFTCDETEITPEVIEIFKTEAKQILIKINYLDIVNQYGLYLKCVE